MVDVSPIGRVRTPYETTRQAPNQGYKGDAEGVIQLDPEFEPGASDLSVGDTILVLWWADTADDDVLAVDRAEGQGVFGTRSPARPNRINITPCEVTRLDGPEIGVRGVDMIDGTPVLDIKSPLAPYGPWAAYADLRDGYEAAHDGDPPTYERDEAEPPTQERDETGPTDE